MKIDLYSALAGKMHLRFTEIFFILFLILQIISCGKSGNANQSSYQMLLLQIAKDVSKSTINFPALDTSFLRSVCLTVNNRGGTIVFFTIGNPTDQPGIRCWLQPIPKRRKGLTLSKQKEEVDKIKILETENRKEIDNFLMKAQALMTDSVRDQDTDLNGFFAAADILLSEPQFLEYKKMVFVLSDGVQSSGNNNSPATYHFKNKNFDLCLTGWKTALPDSTLAIKKFEAPSGFLQFLNQNINQ